MFGLAEESWVPEWNPCRHIHIVTVSLSIRWVWLRFERNHYHGSKKCWRLEHKQYYLLSKSYFVYPFLSLIFILNHPNILITTIHFYFVYTIIVRFWFTSLWIKEETRRSWELSRKGRSGRIKQNAGGGKRNSCSTTMSAVCGGGSKPTLATRSTDWGWAEVGGWPESILQ